MKYRILIETYASGLKIYYPQRKVLFFFWLTFREMRYYSWAYYRISYQTIEEAKQMIKNHAESVYAQHQRRIVKKEIVSVKICV